MFVVLVVAVIVFIKRTHQNYAVGIGISEESETTICGIFKVAETHNIATVFECVEYSVCARVGLQQSLHLKILVHPQRVHALGVKTREKHSYDNKYVDVLVLRAQRQVFIVVLKLLRTCIVRGSKRLVVFLYARLQKILACCVKTVHVFGVLLNGAVLVFCLVGLCGEYGGYAQLLGSGQRHLTLQFFVILYCHLYAVTGEDRVKA